jgi:membrane glycosyltransferase
VAFPKKSDKTDPAFKDKLVVAQLIGRQIYSANPNADDKDLQYGDVLDIKGNVRIIGINNTLVLMFPNGAVTTVVGPLKFDVEKVFKGQNLYKYLNVAK